MTSILDTVKHSLGIEPEYTHFDLDIIMHINTVMVTLRQLGAGPAAGFRITDRTQTWTDYLGEDAGRLCDVQTYLSLKVRLIFDPPMSGSVKESLEKIATELEWRINAEVDPAQNNVLGGSV